MYQGKNMARRPGQIAVYCTAWEERYLSRTQKYRRRQTVLLGQWSRPEDSSVEDQSAVPDLER